MNNLHKIFLLLFFILGSRVLEKSYSQVERPDAPKAAKYTASSAANQKTELLYNGIILPEIWPPKNIDRSRKHIEIPYLISKPEVIPIDIGRQLFVDDFLIEKTTLNTIYHLADKINENPLFKPETETELNGGNIPVAAPFNDGLWYDSEDKLYKMWYHAGWFSGTGYAFSHDGIHWSRPKL